MQPQPLPILIISFKPCPSLDVDLALAEPRLDRADEAGNRQNSPTKRVTFSIAGGYCFFRHTIELYRSGKL
jgi:hypothetical protein